MYNIMVDLEKISDVLLAELIAHVKGQLTFYEGDPEIREFWRNILHSLDIEHQERQLLYAQPDD